MTNDVTLPNMQEPVFPGGKPPTSAYRKFFERLSRVAAGDGAMQEQIAALAARVAELEESGGDLATFIKGTGISIIGQITDPVIRISLSAYLADLLDVSEVAPADRDRLTWNAATELWEPAVILNPDLAAADTDGLAEGAGNLYFTDARADARIALQKGQPLGLATLDAVGKLDAGQLPALAITETFVVASQAAMLALTAEEGDVAVRTDLNKSLILTAAPASTLGNWQELLTPMSPVTSVFGRVGSVVAASGDYTPAQVGADPAGSAAAAQAFAIQRGNHTGTQLASTISDFAAAVRDTILTGLSTASATVITAADTILSALGKLQAQITAVAAALGLRVSGTYTPTTTGAVNVSSTSAQTCNWCRVDGGFVLSGSVVATPTSASTATTVGVSLPFSTLFATNMDCSGPVTAKAAGVPVYETAQIIAQAGANGLNINFYPATTNAYSLRFCIVVPIQP